MSLGPKDEAEARIYAEENLLVDLQHRLQTRCNKLGISRKQLAHRASMTEAQVSRLFSDDANPTVRTIARLFFALEDECILTSREVEKAVGRTTRALASWSSPDAVSASEIGKTARRMRLVQWSALDSKDAGDVSPRSAPQDGDVAAA